MLLRIFQSSLFRVIRREFGRIADNWVLTFVTILGPIVSFLLVAWMFTAAVVRDLPVTLVDKDHTQLSRKIAGMVDATPAVNIVFQSTSLEEAKSIMNKGKSDAVLYIPEGILCDKHF